MEPEGRAGVFKRILVGYDGTRDADEAVRAALRIATAPEAYVMVVAVCLSGGETDEERQSAFERQAHELRRKADGHRDAAERAGLTYHFEAVPGSKPAQVLHSLSRERGFDLLVVGRHGRESATHGGLGKVAHQLAADGTCPVLLVGDGHAVT